MNKRRKKLFFLFFILVFTNLLSCKHKQANSGPNYGPTPFISNIPTYNFAIHPLHNPEKLTQVYSPLISYLNSHVKNAKFILEASRDYENFEEKYQSKVPDFLLPNPYQTIKAVEVGYKVIATAGDPEDFKGIFLVRKDSNIRDPKDLIGKKICYPAKTALAACIMPQYFLYKAGININSDIENSYVGSQESSIMNVYLRLSAVAATWPPPWRTFQKEHPAEASALKIIWETESLINNSVMVRNDIPENIQAQVKSLLVDLVNTQEGKQILKDIETARFIPATDKDYDIVKTYILQFENKVRKIK
jgi:phosphonate transport system substrate-binding protein